MVANTFNHRGGAAVAYTEAFSGDAPQEHLTTGSAVQHHVANQNIVFGFEAALPGWINDHSPAGQTFAYVVVCITFNFKRHAFGQPCA